MTDPTKDEAVQRLNNLLTRLAELVSELQTEEQIKEARLRHVLSQHGPNIDRLTRQQSLVVDEISGLYVSHRQLLLGNDGKSVYLRGGTLSARVSSSLVVSDESLAIRFIRRMRKLRKFTRVGKRVIDKKALKSDPDFAAKVPGVFIQEEERLTIKLADLQAEIVRDLNPLRRNLSS